MKFSLKGARSLVLAAAVVAFGAMVPGIAWAQASASGATDIDVILPELVVLHYFSDVDVTIAGGVLQTWLGSTADLGTGSGSGAVSGTSIQTDVDIASATDYDPDNDSSALPLTLLNAWAVRSLAVDGDSTQVSITLDDDTLDHTSSSDSITISSATVRQTGGGAFAGSTSFSPTGLLSPKLGDVQLTLDLTGATNSGDYLDGQFTISVENI